MLIYVLEIGAYSRRSIEMVTTDVEKVVDAYAKATNKEPYYSSLDCPGVEVWKDGRLIGSFCKFEKSVPKLLKMISEIK